MRRTTVAAAVAVLSLSLSACGGSDDKPDRPVVTETVTVSPTPTVDRASARQDCIEQWLRLLEADQATVENQPAVCDQVPGQAGEMYAEAMLRHNEANRQELKDCMEDPTCKEPWDEP